MRAAVCHGPRAARAETRPRPRAGPEQLLVEVTVAAICLCPERVRHRRQRVRRRSAPDCGGGDPIVLGHEFTGRVVEVGAAVAGFALGDRVVSGAGVWRGECDW